MISTALLSAVAIAGVVLSSLLSTAAGMTEPERIRQWHERGYTWPPTWQPESEEWKKAMEFREKEIMKLIGSDERWANFMQYTQSRFLPTFTEHGFELRETPPAVHAKLKAAVDAGLARWDSLREERQIPVVYTPLPSKFVDMPSVAREVHNELKELHEEWSGLKLVPTSAYGTRLYQNGSSLAFHYDKTTTHVISSIVHIAHEYYDDNEPWPIQIEDFNGKMHSVSLQPGQMLFYESARCLHGRKTQLKGKYYGSIFLHYQPVDPNVWNYTMDDINAIIPPHWRDGVTEQKGSRYSGTCMTIDSLACDGAPPRIINGQEVEAKAPFYSPNSLSQEL